MSDKKNDDIFSNLDDLNFDDLKDSQKEFIEPESIMEDIENESLNENLDNEGYVAETKNSLLDQLTNDSDDNYEEEFDVYEDNYQTNYDGYEEASVQQEEYEDFYDNSISIEDDYEDEDSFQGNDNSFKTDMQQERQSSIMDDMLSDLDEELGENVSQYEEIPEYEEEVPSEEEFDGYYDNDTSVKKGISFDNKLLIKIGIGIGALVVVVILALILTTVLNRGKENKPSLTPTPIVTQPPVATTTPKPDDSIVDDLLGDLDDNKPNKDDKENEGNDDNKDGEDLEFDTPTISPNEPEEEGSVLKVIKGHVVDIKSDEIYIATLGADKYQILLDTFSKFISVEDPSTINVRVVENETDKFYHLEECTCEGLPTDVMNYLSLPDAESEGYVQASCAKYILIDPNKDPKDYDYSLYPELNGMIYTPMSILDGNLDSNITIGTEVSITYIRDNDTLLNEVIEIKAVKQVDNSKDEDDKDGEDSSSDVPVITEDTNHWGEDWNAIVDIINDRRKKEQEALEAEKNDNLNQDIQLEIEEPAKFESVQTEIFIEEREFVWFQISWKKNANLTSVPSSDNVTVELLTPQNSLINEENIDKYGKLWIDETTGVVNIVLKNTVPGYYKVVFTKEAGTYLGDVSIKAIPITGFLQIKDASAVYSNGRLEVIWNVEGIYDDNVVVEVYAINGKKPVLLYSANSVDDGIHSIDMASINVSKIAGNTYDIVVRVTDIDITASAPYTITKYHLTDTITIENVEIPRLK